MEGSGLMKSPFWVHYPFKNDSDEFKKNQVVIDPLVFLDSYI